MKKNITCTKTSLILVSCTVKKNENGYICPKCSRTLKASNTFKRHVNDIHSGTAKAFNVNNLSDERKLVLRNKPKLPKVYSKQELQIDI